MKVNPAEITFKAADAALKTIVFSMKTAVTKLISSITGAKTFVPGFASVVSAGKLTAWRLHFFIR